MGSDSSLGMRKSSGDTRWCWLQNSVNVPKLVKMVTFTLCIPQFKIVDEKKETSSQQGR